MASSVLAGTHLRACWRRVLILGLALGATAGLATAVVAGAERSRTSLDRFAARSVNPNLFISAAPSDDLDDMSPAIMEAGDLPGVVGAGRIRVFALNPVIRVDLDASGERYFPMLASVDGRVPFELATPRVLRGRLPDPQAPLELSLSERNARALGVDVGGTIEMQSLTPRDLELMSDDFPEPTGPDLEFSVVGVTRDVGDVSAREEDISFSFLTPAFAERYAGEIAAFTDLAAVVLEDGAGQDLLGAAVAELDPEAQIDFLGTSNGDASISANLSVIASSLQALAAVIALAGGAALTQAVLRSARGDRQVDPVLAAMGATRRDLRLRGAAPILGATVLGAILTAPVAVAASPLFPIGLARRAEPDPGPSIDVGVLSAGTLGALALGLVLAALSQVQFVARSRHLAQPRSLRLPGWHLADLANGARGRADLRSARIVVAVAVVALVAAATFAASLDGLLRSPEDYGVVWDAGVAPNSTMGSSGQGSVEQEVVDAIRRDPLVAEADVGVFQIAMRVEGVPMLGYGIGDGSGTIAPVVAEGRVPRSVDEIALGPASLRRTGARIGDQVEVITGAERASFTVVGRAVLPVSIDGGSTADGAAFIAPALERLSLGDCSEFDSCYRQVLVRWEPGSSRPQIVDALARIGDPAPEWHEAPPPGAVVRLRQIAGIPRFVAGLVALIGALACGQGIASYVGGRRRDFSVLRGLGCTRGQLRRVVAHQLALSLAGATAVGVLLGAAVGRTLWGSVADRMSVVATPLVPAAPTGAIAAAVVAVGVLLGAMIVARSGRRAPAEDLRTE